MTFDKFTLKAQDSIAVAQQMAVEHGNQQLEPEHILLAMLKDNEGLIPTIIKKAGVDINILLTAIEAEVKRFPKVQGSGFNQAHLSNRSQGIVNTAFKKASDLKDEYVSTEHLLIAIADESSGNGGKILIEMGVSSNTIMQILKTIRGNQRVTDQNPEGKYQALQKYGRDLNELARLGKMLWLNF